MFWNAWRAKRKIRIGPGRGISPEEALKRGRFGEFIVMQWERRQGRSPVNHADENVGYDIESFAKNGSSRCIEVKSFGGRPLELTDKEQQIAKELGIYYYLYVVTREGGKYSIRVIRNPAETCKLNARPTVRFHVKDWQNKGVVYKSVSYS